MNTFLRICGDSLAFENIEWYALKNVMELLLPVAYVMCLKRGENYRKDFCIWFVIECPNKKVFLASNVFYILHTCP